MLLAEGKDEQLVLPELLEAAGVPWPAAHPPVWIEDNDGIETLLAPDTINGELKGTGLVALGLVVDANGDPEARWDRIRALLTAIFATFPQIRDPAGIIHEEVGRPRLGVWIAPDNERAGMLETLLLATGDARLHDHVRSATTVAKQLGAPFREAHREKALLHTWLAWQDPPGQPMNRAAQMGMLDGASPSMSRFVAWFRRLFEI